MDFRISDLEAGDTPLSVFTVREADFVTAVAVVAPVDLAATVGSSKLLLDVATVGVDMLPMLALLNLCSSSRVKSALRLSSSFFCLDAGGPGGGIRLGLFALRRAGVGCEADESSLSSEDCFGVTDGFDLEVEEKSSFRCVGGESLAAVRLSICLGLGSPLFLC